jgi:alginate O-acetyltransferase complex protein AlgJ
MKNTTQLKRSRRTFIAKLALFLTFSSVVTAFAADSLEQYPGIIGKDEWLFYRNELTSSEDAPGAKNSLSLIQQFNQVLQKKGVQLLIVMVPIKMRIHEEHLPDDIKINDYMRSNYERMLATLRSSGVTSVDLNTAFLKSPHRTSDTPLFFRLDTHWAKTGAMLAAETIGAEILSNPVLKNTISQIPTQSYTLTTGKAKGATRSRDILQLLPPDSPARKYPYERYFSMSVSRTDVNNSDLLGKQESPDIGLVGSSYTIDWTGFADGLRYSLQKNIFSIGVSATQGSWVGMETYLRDDAFQTNPPKLLLWEIPERDMYAPPDYKYREARYILSNAEWLKRVTDLVNKAPTP